ncbi:hypothetical protein Bcep1808_0168 [Burkholderia vietnamiensis G4]|uniref:Uncharacterized protein n=1 Tax=Burkholderia vietnamiensis (strain G4 / LMG 22486) TaxID=269482 RepID=A4JA88_BURVG|nr:hypothetical protein Bcep1808_0168 [Burkholderia vietnamiensis G4]
MIKQPATTDVTYVRIGGRNGAPICYHRIRNGRATRRFNAKVQRAVTRLAYAICTRAPDVADTILELPARRVGRMVKAALRRAPKVLRKRRSFKRRPTSSVLRV